MSTLLHSPSAPDGHREASVRFCTIPHVDSADEIPERGEAGCGQNGEGVTMKYRLTPQPQDNSTTPHLVRISVALRIFPVLGPYPS